MRQKLFKTESTGFALKARLWISHVLSLATAEGKKRLPQSTNLTTCSSEEVGGENSAALFLTLILQLEERGFLHVMWESYCSQ